MLEATENKAECIEDTMEQICGISFRYDLPCRNEAQFIACISFARGALTRSRKQPNFRVYAPFRMGH